MGGAKGRKRRGLWKGVELGAWSYGNRKGDKREEEEGCIKLKERRERKESFREKGKRTVEKG